MKAPVSETCEHTAGGTLRHHEHPVPRVMTERKAGQ